MTDLIARCAALGWTLRPDGDEWELLGNGAPAAFGSDASLSAWLERQERAKARAKARVQAGIPAEYLNQIVTGDARELAKRIPDASVDLIFTDPPYPREYLPLYGWLAETAARVLKPDGLCFCYCGKAWIDEIFTLMCPHLRYVWIVNLWESGKTRIAHGWKAAETWRPILVFGKDRADIGYCMDGIASWGRDKRYHKWGQELAAPTYYIRKLTDRASLVWEPFTGGGTVPAVCKMLNRNYIAFEIDPDTASRARARVEATQAMHPVFLEQQEQMFDQEAA